MKLSSCMLVILALLYVSGSLVEGKPLVGMHRRSLKGCSALAIGVAGKTSQEEEAIAEAASEAFASSQGCSNVQANAQATAEAIATATASAFAKTSTQVIGDDCDNAFAKGRAQAEGFAKAVAEAIAKAKAKAENKDQNVFSGTLAREIETDIKSAVANADSSTIGAGESVSISFARVVASASVKSIATAIADVECEGDESGIPPTTSNDSAEAKAIADGNECACSDSDTVGGVFTGRPGCGQHALATDPNDAGYFCYVVGGSGCRAARESNEFKGAYWIDCKP